MARLWNLNTPSQLIICSLPSQLFKTHNIVYKDKERKTKKKQKTKNHLIWNVTHNLYNEQSIP